MAVFVALEPYTGDLDTAQETAVLVRDGFHFWAFLAPVLWCLIHGLWLETLASLAFLAGVTALDIYFDPGNGFIWVMGLVFQIWCGLEAGNLKAWALRRRGFSEWGPVEAKNKCEAELRYAALADIRPISLAGMPWKQPIGAPTMPPVSQPASANADIYPWER